MLAIGEFSRVTHLSVRTLRRYHDAGLLEPAAVDPASGYRYYTADQIPTAQVIHRLRELDVPLPDVRRILRSPDPGARATLVSDHLRRLESELDRTRAASRRCVGCSGRSRPRWASSCVRYRRPRWPRSRTTSSTPTSSTGTPAPWRSWTPW